MIDYRKIKSETPVVCSQEGQFAIVDQLDGIACVKLKKDEAGQHHYIPFSWIVSTDDDKVKIDRPGAVAMQEWSINP